MSKARRTVLSGVVTPIVRESAPVPLPLVEAEPPAARRRNAKEATVQQTVYLPPAVHDQLRELAFVERVKMHALIMEGLDSVFNARGLKSIADITRMQS